MKAYHSSRDTKTKFRALIQFLIIFILLSNGCKAPTTTLPPPQSSLEVSEFEISYENLKKILIIRNSLKILSDNSPEFQNIIKESLQNRELNNINIENVKINEKQAKQILIIKEIALYLAKNNPTKLHFLIHDIDCVNVLKKKKFYDSVGHKREAVLHDVKEDFQHHVGPYKERHKNSYHTYDTASDSDDGSNKPLLPVHSTPEFKSPLITKQEKALKIEKDVNFHVVEKGDTLTSLSKKYRIDIEKLATINKIENINFIKAGMRLKISN